MNETIYILLPVHNRLDITRRFIKCLTDQTYSKYHLVLIDDGSTDGTADMVRKQIRPLTIIAGNGHWWWGGALHKGYKWLRAQNPLMTDIVLIINDDTEFDKNFLETGVTYLRDHQKTLLLAQCFSKEDNTLIDAGIHVDWKQLKFEQPLENGIINCLSTRGLFLRVADFFSIGGFHPLLLPHYLSDYEFTIRAHKKGMRLTTDPAVKLRFDTSTTGFHRVEYSSFPGIMKSVFTNKSAINPLVLTIFVALACPWPRKLGCWFRIISRSLSYGWSLVIKRAVAR